MAQSKVDGQGRINIHTTVVEAAHFDFSVDNRLYIVDVTEDLREFCLVEKASDEQYVDGLVKVDPKCRFVIPRWLRPRFSNGSLCEVSAKKGRIRVRFLAKNRKELQEKFGDS